MATIKRLIQKEPSVTSQDEDVLTDAGDAGASKQPRADGRTAQSLYTYGTNLVDRGAYPVARNVHGSSGYRYIKGAGRRRG